MRVEPIWRKQYWERIKSQMSRKSWCCLNPDSSYPTATDNTVLEIWLCDSNAFFFFFLALVYFVSIEPIISLELEGKLRIITSSPLTSDRAGIVAVMADKQLQKGQLGSLLPTSISDVAHCYTLLRIIKIINGK